MTSPIQIPTLHPTDVVREPGLDQPQGQLSSLAQLLIAKGHLALQNEQFQAQQQQMKQKKQQLDMLGQHLSTLFQNPQALSPENMPSTLGQAASEFGTAGEPGAASAAIRDLPNAVLQQQGSRSRQALMDLVDNWRNGDIRDPAHNAEFLMHAGVLGGPEVAHAFSEGLKPLQMSPVKVAYDPIFGIVGINTNTVKFNPDGSLAGDPEVKVLLKAPPKAGGLPAQKRNDIGGVALQFISNMEHALNTDPKANLEPTEAAGAENIGSFAPAKSLMGAAGALGIGPGTPQAAAQQLRSPMRQTYRENTLGFAHTYLTWLGGTPRSNVLLQSVLSAIDPGAGATPAARATAWQTILQIRKAIIDSRNGKPVKWETLPFFSQVQAVENQSEGGAVAPQGGATPAQPLTARDLLGQEEP